MDTNPYTSPSAEGPTSQRTSGDGAFVRHRAFSHKSSFWGLTMGHSRQKLREQAEEFINVEVGAGNVVAIVEHDNPPSVVVWFKEV